jgi:hypothetical protein
MLLEANFLIDCFRWKTLQSACGQPLTLVPLMNHGESQTSRNLLRFGGFEFSLRKRVLAQITYCAMASTVEEGVIELQPRRSGRQSKERPRKSQSSQPKARYEKKQEQNQPPEQADVSDDDRDLDEEPPKDGGKHLRDLLINAAW